MQTRKLGRTGIDVSSICLGTMTYGEQTGEDDARAQMDFALEHGINFFDTAENYSIPPKAETQGSTEKIIGRWMKDRKARGKIALASKVSGRSDMTWMRKDGSRPELNRKNIEEALDSSLRRLQTDHIDLYQVHWPDRAVSDFGSNAAIFKDMRGRAGNSPENSIESTLEVLDGFVKSGKVRAIGLSNENAWGAMTWLHHSTMRGMARPQSIQNAYSLLNRTFEFSLAETAMREDLGLLAYSPLGQGFLTGKYQGGALPAGARKTLFNRAQRYDRPGNAEAIDDYMKIAKDFGLDCGLMSLAFVLSRPFVTSMIFGARNMEQLRFDIACKDVKITPEIEARIDAVHLKWTSPAY